MREDNRTQMSTSHTGASRKLDGMIKWAVENLVHGKHFRSPSSNSYYITDIGNTNVILRISDHLKLNYSQHTASLLVNNDGSMCAVYMDRLLPLKDTADAKAFLRHLNFVMYVRCGKKEKEDEDIDNTTRQLIATPAFKEFRNMTNKQRKRFLQLAKEYTEKG